MASQYRFDKAAAEVIMNFSSRHASSVHLGSGDGESHAYVVHFEPDGEIGEHETGFGQLFIVVEGTGWVRAGSKIHDVGVGDVVRLERGEIHAKGSETGMTAVMVQMFDIDPLDEEPAAFEPPADHR